MRARALAWFVAAIAVACASGGVATADDDVSPQLAYVRAVATMRSLQSPPFARYDSNWQSTGLGFDFAQDRDRIVIDVGFGSDFVHTRNYAAAYRAADRTLHFSNSDGEQLVGKGHLLEPTWAGAYDILRYGLRGGDASDVAAVAPSSPPTVDAPATSTPAPPDTAATGTPPPDIARVTAISPLYYRVEDAGTRPCQGLGMGRGLHLIARHDVRAHPLTDVVLDPASGRFCSMTFVIKESGLAGITGHYTIDFAPYGSYWLVADGLIDINVRFFGIAAKHATLRWAIADLTTPSVLPDETFALPPTPSPAPSARR